MNLFEFWVTSIFKSPNHLFWYLFVRIHNKLIGLGVARFQRGSQRKIYRNELPVCNFILQKRKRISFKPEWSLNDVFDGSKEGTS